MKGDVYMKDKIVLFVIGVLVGAIIATGSFYVYTIANSNCNSNQMNNSGQPPEMPNGQNGQNGQPPELPGNSSTQDSNS